MPSCSFTVTTAVAAAGVTAGTVATAAALLPERGVTPSLHGLRNAIRHVNVSRLCVPQERAVACWRSGSSPLTVHKGIPASGQTLVKPCRGRPLRRSLNGVAATVPSSTVAAAGIVATTDACSNVTDGATRARRRRKVSL